MVLISFYYVYLVFSDLWVVGLVNI